MTGTSRAAAVLVLLGAGVLLGLWVRSGVPAVDRSVLDFAVHHRSPDRTDVFRGFTQCGGTLAVTVVTLLVVATAAVRRWWLLTAQVVLAGLGTMVFIVGGKAVFGRPRPPAATQLGVLQTFSFPSGHALGSMVAGCLVLAAVFAATRSKWVRALAAVGVALYVVTVGLSRLYLGVHWSTDVLGGWLIGAGWALLCLSIPPLRHHQPASLGDHPGARPRSAGTTG